MRELTVLDRTVLDRTPAVCCSALGATAMSDEDAETTAAVFKALADPGRVRIMNLLANADAPVCVCDLTPELGLSQPTVSFHLKKLVRAGLLQREQRGVCGGLLREPRGARATGDDLRAWRSPRRR